MQISMPARSPSDAARRCGSEQLVTHVTELAGSAVELREECRIFGAERRHDLVVRELGERSTVAHVFHVSSIVAIEWMKDRVVPPVKLERQHAETLAERQVERRGGLHPFPFEVDLGEAVIDEEVAAH